MMLCPVTTLGKVIKASWLQKEFTFKHKASQYAALVSRLFLCSHIIENLPTQVSTNQ